MGKPRDKIRDLFDEKKDKSVDCKYCKIKYKFINVNKMKNHILKCMKCPNDVKAQFKTGSSLTSSSASSLSSMTTTSALQQRDFSTPTRLNKFVDSINPVENVRFIK